MGYNTVSKFVRVSRATDASQISKNNAQAQAALVNASAKQRKLRLEEMAAEDKHEMHGLKVARESIKLEQEAKAYWNSLSDEEKAALSAEIEKEKELALEAYKNKTENASASERIDLKKRTRKNKVEDLKDKLWLAIQFIVTVIIVIFLIFVVFFMVDGFLRAIF